MAVADVRRPEEARNRLLRRVDWRFLLPDPAPRTSVCFADGLLAEAVDLISTRVAEPGRAPADECELAVAVDPDGATLRAARAALRPGGSCYTEWYSPLAGGARGVRRRLRAAGFDDVTCYWAWPAPAHARPHFWVPLEAPGARGHFLSSRPVGRDAVRRVGRAVRRVAWTLALRASLLLPVCAVARKPTRPTGQRPPAAEPSRTTDGRSPSASGMNVDLVDTIRAGWEGWGLGPAPDRLSWLVLTGGARTISKFVGLVFAEPDPRPRLVVKLPRVPESAPGLLQEAATLEAVARRRPGGVRGVPRLLFCRERAGGPAVGETALAGQRVITLLRRDNYRDLAMKGATWLAELAGPAELGRRPRGAWWDRLIAPVLAEFEESFGPVVDHGLLRETRGILATIGALPLVPEQRDFAPWNVLIDSGGELAVLDWESAELEGLPALDLLYFLTYLAFELDGVTSSGRWRESYRATLDPTTFTGRVRAESLGRYVGAIGLDPAALDPLRALVWLIHSRSEYHHLAADAAGRPGREALRRSLFIGLWEEEVRRAARS